MADRVESTPNAPVPQGVGRILRNVFSNWGSYIFSLVVNLFLAPFVVRHLGDAGYGLWTLIVSLTGYLGLLDLGVRGAVTRYVAKFHAAEEHREAGRVTHTALLIFTAVGMLAIAAGVALAYFALPSFRISPEQRAVARLVLILAGVNVGVSLVSGVFGGILAGLQRFDLMNLLEVSTSGLRAVAIVAALAAGKGLVALAVIQLAFSVARGMVSAGLSLRLYPQLRESLGGADREHFRLIFSFSFYAFLLHVGVSLIYYTDTVVIGAFLPVGLITFFAIGGNLVEYSRALVSGISQTISPVASALEAHDDQGELRNLLLHSSRFASFVTLPVLLTFMLRGASFIGLWMGPRYAQLSGNVLWVLALGSLVAGPNYPAGAIMLGISRHKPLVPALLAEGACNLALSIVLLRSMGILGVAWGTVIPTVFVHLVFWPWYVHRTLGIPPLTYLFSGWIRPGIAAIPFALLSSAIDRLWPAPNLFVFFLQVGLSLPVALLGFWYICLQKTDRQTYSRKLLSSLGRVLRRA